MTQWPIIVEWVHPSVRDTVIEYLMGHDSDRQRFLSTARASGAVMALSTAGGKDGALTRPLLRKAADWAALEETVQRIASSEDSLDQYILLQGVNEALRAAQNDPEVLNKIHDLATEMLCGLRSTWNSQHSTIRFGALRLFYEISVEIKELIPSPNLSTTWSQAKEAVETALLEEVDYASFEEVSNWISLVSLLQQYEPRYLLIEGIKKSVDDPLMRTIEWVRNWSDSLSELSEVESDWEIDDNGEYIEMPVSPSSDEEDEQILLREAIDFVTAATSAGRNLTKTTTKLIDRMREQLEARVARQHQYDTWQSENSKDSKDSWSAARNQGSGDFDIVEFFSDL
jgi:hypothetical protein